jgi:hypothetical protein
MSLPREKAIKTSWHLLLVGTTILEMSTAKTTLRKLLLGACAGWHAAAAYIDLTENP